MNPKKIDALILSTKTVLTNTANVGQIGTALARFGYDAEALALAKGMLERLEKLHTGQKREYGEHRAATLALNEARKRLQKQYGKHLKLARATVTSPDAIQALGLAGDRKSALPDWLEQVRAFYVNAPKMPLVRDALARVTISEEVLQQGLAAVEEVAALRAEQRKEAGEAQAATEARDIAADELQQWMNRLVPIAQVALEENPQMLEALGIKTPKSGSSTYGDEDEDEEDEDEEVGGLEQT